MSTELVVAGTYGLEQVKDVANLWREELGADFIPKFPRVRVPAAGATIWSIPGSDPETPDHAKDITGVLVAFHKSSRLYLDAFEDRDPNESSRPDAWSNDGVTQFVPEETIAKAAERGLPAPLTDLARCPYNQFPSDGGVQLKPGYGGKANGEYYELYILVAGNVLPWQVSVPASSRSKVEEYLGFVVGQGNAISSVETTIGLREEKSKAGIKYSQVTLRSTAKLDPTEAKDAKEYSNGIKAIVKRDPFAKQEAANTTVVEAEVVQAAPVATQVFEQQADEATQAEPLVAVASGDIDL